MHRKERCGRSKSGFAKQSADIYKKLVGVGEVHSFML